jgi:hypothetical protein
MADDSPEFFESICKPKGYLPLLARAELLRMYCCAAGSFGIFSSIFNYLPFRSNGPPFNLYASLAERKQH